MTQIKAVFVFGAGGLKIRFKIEGSQGLDLSIISCLRKFQDSLVDNPTLN